MNISEFDYPITSGQIAQFPLAERDSSKLLVLHRKTGDLESRVFRDIKEYFQEGDVLVLNDTRVIPVRLFGKKPSGGRVEVTLLKELGRNVWSALVKGTDKGSVMLADGISASISRESGSPAQITFSIPEQLGHDIRDCLDRLGVMPLPPYIKRSSGASDRNTYQTIYAKNDGAVAAPTAGLHFTEGLLTALKDKGVHVRTVTLHVGYGTFKPVIADDIRQHRMDEEHYEIPEPTSAAVNLAKDEGRRVIAVGTTVTRTLEASALDSGRTVHGAGSTSLFICNGFRFRVVDALITNFHQPRSTPLILAMAFSGKDILRHAYAEAQRMGYRFFSYGDAMLIL